MNNADRIDELNREMEAALAAGNDGEAEELYAEIERLCEEMN